MSCIVCKKLWVPGSVRSFHKFPKDPKRKQKWMEIVGISKITSSSSVCGDHFTPESYHQTDGYTTVKRLLSTAEPIMNTNIQVLSDVTSKATTVNTNVQNGNRSTSTIEYVKVIHGDKQTNTIVENGTVINSINDNNTKTNDSVINFHGKGLLTRIHSGNNVVNEITEEEVCPIDNTLLNAKSLQNVNQVVSNINQKRKNIVNDQESCPNKRFRFMDGCAFKTISKHDFKTDEAWETFMRYVTIQRKKTAVNRRKILRKKNKVKTFQDLIDNLRKNETEAAAKYLEGLPDTMKQLISRMKEKNEQLPFFQL